MKYISVVNTINRPQYLVERCLNSLLTQKIPPIKVILIDQNEKELQLTDSILENPLFQRIKVNFKSVSAARNSVPIPANSEWIFFCDDDGYADKNYSEILNDLITQNVEIEIFAGSIIREDNLEFYTLRHKNGGSLKKFRNTKNLMGSNFVVKTSTFNRLQRFDENFGAGSYWGSSEETDFCWKAYFNKVPMEYFPQLKVFHVPPFNESIKFGFKKAFQYGVGKGALVHKWLIKKGKMIVIYELIEMLITPFILSFIGILKLKPEIIVIQIATLVGRIYGFTKAFFIKVKY
uniref:Glycosyltransferase n=1 Tax=Ignavibacterium album TaxID=591197 RepID=A0A832LJY4_9BACT